MSNDVPDWTQQHKSNLFGSVSGVAQGDVSAAALQADSVTETLGGSAGFGGQAIIVLASFKAVAGQVIAKVGTLGALAVGTANSVTPAFGQSPTTGNLLVAWVTAGSADPTTVAAGWVKAKSDNFNGQFAAIWYKPNAAGGDAAPTFTVGAGSNLMSAQLGEFSGAPTASPTDQAGSSAISGNPGSVAATALDVAFGDLVLTASRWIEAGSGVSTFTDTINNGGTVVQAGAAEVGSGGFRACNGTYTIIPAATVAQPLGVVDWAYDATGVSDPGAGVAASVVLAATPGKTYTAALLAASALTNAANTFAGHVKLLDGATQLVTFVMAIPATTFSEAPKVQLQTAYKGTRGNSMTWQFDVGSATVQQTANIGAYLR